MVNYTCGFNQSETGNYFERQGEKTAIHLLSFIHLLKKKKREEEIKLMRKYLLKINMVYMLLNRAGRLKFWKRGAVFN